jgi:hypothetical protein
MPNVTVDADDLEALLFATSGIKDLEAALQQRKTNPLVKSGMGRMAIAHDRLSTAWRRAKREADYPAIYVSADDLAELKAMFTRPDGSWMPVVVLDDYPTRFAQSLLLVEAGPLWEGYRIEWPAPNEPAFVINQLEAKIRYGARLTHYGMQVLGVTEADIALGPSHMIGAQRLLGK